MPRATVRLIGMECLSNDGTQTNPLKLGRFMLTSRSLEIPGIGPTAAGLPPIGKWVRFKQVPDSSATTGDALVVVPDLPNGTDQLWWWCDDGSGPGGGIHYSTGPRLRIGPVAPDTAIEPNAPADTRDGSGVALLASAGVVFVLALLMWQGRLRRG